MNLADLLRGSSLERRQWDARKLKLEPWPFRAWSPRQDPTAGPCTPKMAPDSIDAVARTGSEALNAVRAENGNPLDKCSGKGANYIRVAFRHRVELYVL